VLDQLFGLVLSMLFGQSLGVNLFSVGLFVFERPTTCGGGFSGLSTGQAMISSGCSTASVLVWRKDYLHRHTCTNRIFLGLSNYLALSS
jgi:hypothetical protein